MSKWRAKGINNNWSLVLLKATHSWREKGSWRKAASEVSKALLKNSAPEDKRSRSHIIRSCIIRSCIIRSCLIRSHFTRSWRSTGFAKDSRIEESSLQKLSIGFENTTKDCGILQRSFQRCLKACACNFGRKRWHCTEYELYKHFLHYSVLCPHYKTRKQL